MRRQKTEKGVVVVVVVKRGKEGEGGWMGLRVRKRDGRQRVDVRVLMMIYVEESGGR